MSSTIRDAWTEAVDRLRALGSDAPERDARDLLRRALGLGPRTFLLLDFSAVLDPAASIRLDELLARRETHEPLQYLLGTVPFCDLEFDVGPGVLIPRPETEVLVERLTYWVGRSRMGNDAAAGSSSWLVDVGTGTGAILLTLLARLPGWKGLGIDRSPEALVFARGNLERAVRHGFPDLGERAHFLLGDLLDPLADPVPDGTLGLIVSNPPYIPTGELAALAPEVRDHEPRVALDGGEDGLVLVRRIADRAAQLLPPGGLLAFELAPDQPETVADLLDRLGFRILESYRDLAGRTRGVIARPL